MTDVLDRYIAENTRCKAEISALKKRVGMLESENARLRKNLTIVAHHSSQIQESEFTYSFFEENSVLEPQLETIDMLSTYSNTLLNSVSKQDNRLQSLESQLNELTELFEHVKDESGNAVATIREIFDCTASVFSSVEGKYKGKIEILNKELEEAKSTIEKYKTELTHTKSQIGKIQQNNEQIIASLELELETTKIELAKIKDKHENKTNMGQLTNNLNNEGIHLNILEKELNNEREKATFLENELEFIYKENKTRDSFLSDLKTNINALRVDSELLNSQLDVRSSEIFDLMRQVADARIEAATAFGILESSLKSCEASVQGEMREYTKSLSRLAEERYEKLTGAMNLLRNVKKRYNI